MATVARLSGRMSESCAFAQPTCRDAHLAASATGAMLDFPAYRSARCGTSWGSLVLVALLACGALAAPAAAAGDAQIKVLSNRADLVSGGDALVQVVPPAGVDAARCASTSTAAT